MENTKSMTKDAGFSGGESIYNDHDSFVEYVANDVIRSLKEKDKKYLINHPDPVDHHFGLGLYIRNKYIHGKELCFLCFPDDLSSEIVRTIIRKLAPAGERIRDIAETMIKSLKEMGDGASVSTRALLAKCGFGDDEFTPADLTEIHNALFDLAEANGLEMDMSAHEFSFEGVPYDLKFTVRF